MHTDSRRRTNRPARPPIPVPASLARWHHTLGAVSIGSRSAPKAQVFYWVTIMFSQTLGTAPGDCTAGTAGTGCRGSALVFPQRAAACAR